MKYEKKWKRWILLYGVCALFCNGCSLYPHFDGNSSSEASTITSTTSSSDVTGIIKSNSETDTQEEDTEKVLEDARILVHVCGYVKEPGLYELTEGQRAGDAIEMAGGFKKKANQDAINLAALLEDGMQLYVPSKEESGERTQGNKVSAEDSSLEKGADSTGQVNINTAGAEELTSLSGIGEARAESIVAYREEHGFFSSIEDIKNVDGIGDGIFEKIRDSITV